MTDSKFAGGSLSAGGSGSVLQFANPDIAETDGISVVLKGEGGLVGVGLVFGGGVGAHPAGAAAEDSVVLDKDAVVQDGEGGAAGDLAPLIEERAVEDDVVALPLAGLAADVDEGFFRP